MTKEPVLTITEIFYYLKTVVKTKKGKKCIRHAVTANFISHG